MHNSGREKQFLRKHAEISINSFSPATSDGAFAIRCGWFLWHDFNVERPRNAQVRVLEGETKGEGVRHTRFFHGMGGVLIAWGIFSQALAAQPLISTMRPDVRGVHEENGFRIAPVPELSGRDISGDEAPAQAYEIIRPDNQPIDIGRLSTSCACVQLSTWSFANFHFKLILKEIYS
ncbi:MAG: hypothetical protein LBE84_10660 [Planctomycetota bacterium]|jgi:hypothetical protein|nr:hypothetical protein [Planctomycetota bacterium]